MELKNLKGIMFNTKTGRYKVRKEPSPAKRCEKSGKDAKGAMFYGRKADSAMSCI